MSRNLTACLAVALTLAFAAASGCNKKDDKPSATGGAKATPEGGHAEEGPHGGHLVELGNEEYHAEVVHDDKTNTVTVYLLDGKGKKSVSTSEKEVTLNLTAGGKPAQFKLPAVPDSGDPAGESSRFELSDESLMKAADAEDSTGRLSVKIGGKSYSGAVEHHDEHDGHK